MLQRMSLRTRFILFALACVVPLVIAVAFFLNRSIERNTDQLITNQYTIASLVDRSVTSFFDRNISVLESLASNPAIASMDVTKADPLLGQASAVSSEFTGLFLVDASGSIVRYPSNTPVEYLDGLGDQFTNTMTNQQVLVSSRIPVSEDVVNIVITVPVISVTESEAAVANSQPTTDDQGSEGEDPEVTTPGQVVGALGVVIRMEQLEQVVLPLARGRTEIAVVRGDNENFLATSGIRTSEDSYIDGKAEVLDLARNGGTGDFTGTAADGTALIGVYQPLVIENMTWATIVTNPAPESYAETLWYEGLLVLVLAMLVIIALAIVLGEMTSRPLRLLVNHTEAMRRGDFSTAIEPVGSGEIRDLSNSMATVTSQVELHLKGLEDVQYIRETQTRQMRDLLRRTLRLQEDERRRLAAEIHDAVSPLITGALYQARALQMSNGSTPPEERDAALESVNDLLERATEELHGVIFDLRPPDLDDLGIVAAVQAYVGSIKRPSLNVYLELGEEPPGLTSEVRLGLYRIVQEALHNVMRHSGADEALVRIESTEDLLRLTIRDNGSGFDPETSIRPTSLGLLSMRERAASIGANLTVVSRPGGGAAIIVERTHTGSVMSDDVLADLISIEHIRQAASSDGQEDVATENGDTVHNGTHEPVAHEGDSGP
jgi:signal transduction histidine kinase